MNIFFYMSGYICVFSYYLLFSMQCTCFMLWIIKSTETLKHLLLTVSIFLHCIFVLMFDYNSVSSCLSDFWTCFMCIAIINLFKWTNRFCMDITVFDICVHKGNCFCLSNQIQWVSTDNILQRYSHSCIKMCIRDSGQCDYFL